MGLEVLFVAPHPDDVCFSVGGLVSDTTAHKHLVSVFTRSAWSEPTWTGGKDEESITAAKRSEDVAFCAACDLEYHSVGLPDPSVRRPIGREGAMRHTWQKSKDDPVLIAAAESALVSLLDEYSFDLVVGPLGVGKHRDHVLCNAAVRSATRNRGVPVVYYEDLPYSRRLSRGRITMRALRVGLGLRPLVYRSSLPVSAKQELASLYVSQFSPVIIDALAEHSARVASWHGGGDGMPTDRPLVVERLWASARTAVPEELLRPVGVVA